MLFIAESLGIRVFYKDLHSQKPLLDGYAIPKQHLIIIDKTLHHTIQGNCVLAEEIGHCIYPPLSDHVIYHTDYYSMNHWNRDNLAVKVAKEENQAIFFATNLLIPDSEFWKYFESGSHEIYEWCEHFHVAEWFMRRKIGFMRTKQRFRWRNAIARACSG